MKKFLSNFKIFKNSTWYMTYGVCFRGFTLMEVMVAISIFTIVMMVGISSVLAVNQSSAQSRADREALDRVSYLLEHLTRKIRTASEIIDGGANGIEFTNQFGDTEIYTFVPAVGGGTLNYEIIKYDETGAVASRETYNLTPPDRDLIELSKVSFLVIGNDSADGLQPSVRMIMAGVVPDRKQKSTFEIQTTISQRLLQLDETL